MIIVGHQLIDRACDSMLLDAWGTNWREGVRARHGNKSKDTRIASEREDMMQNTKLFGTPYA